jgi:hypothetical protein
MAAVLKHTAENVSKLWLAFRLSMPFCKHSGGYFDIPAKFLRGVTPQEETVKKGRFPLRKIEFVGEL